MKRQRTLDEQVEQVVRSGNCSGCGACCLLDAGLSMQLDATGFMRPQRRPGSTPASSSSTFSQICPGVLVRAQRPQGSTRHPTMGPSVDARSGWAADPELRHRGSSGGALSALAAWLVGSGRVSRVVGAAADATVPTRTVTVQIATRQDAVDAAGSRYGPVANAAWAQPGSEDLAFIGKPCEVSAVRALAEANRTDGPLLLSFFCAGTPSQGATDDLARELAAGQGVREMWYRGRGWPGRFTVVRNDGSDASLSYDDSWGKHLGPAAQWRCKICVDGVGESADLVAADFWRTDERGYPLFDEGDGISAIIARTQRGAEVVRAAVAEGVLATEPLDLQDLAAVQPFQVMRRSTLIGRLLGTRLAGASTPSYTGFGLLSFALRHPLQHLRAAKGSFQRTRRRNV